MLVQSAPARDHDERDAPAPSAFFNCLASWNPALLIYISPPSNSAKPIDAPSVPNQKQSRYRLNYSPLTGADDGKPRYARACGCFPSNPSGRYPRQMRLMPLPSEDLLLGSGTNLAEADQRDARHAAASARDNIYDVHALPWLGRSPSAFAAASLMYAPALVFP